jgi:hypothetical protein
MRHWFRLCTIVLVSSCGARLDSADNNGGVCDGPLGPPIAIDAMSAMTACCQAEQGHAHCLDSVPSTIQPFVAACDTGGYCIPDSFLATGASVPPASCTAFGGAGVCLSKCIPEVAQNEGILKPDVCAGEDDLCVPCISPLDGTSTGACELISIAHCNGDDVPTGGDGSACDDPATCNYDANCPPVFDPTSLPSCGADAHCLDAALVADPAEASRLGVCPTDGTKLCVPDVFLRTGGKFTPATCSSVNAAEGRCLSLVLPAVAAQASLLPQDTCAASERCAPCFDPISGDPTGACSLSCDTGPTTQPTQLDTCCHARAHCVPKTSIPTAEQSNLDNDSCDDADLCVPDQILEDDPIATCTANSFVLGDYTGVCLSDCFHFGIEGVALAKGSCDSHELCAPCVLSGQPTGAPGCPP